MRLPLTFTSTLRLLLSLSLLSHTSIAATPPPPPSQKDPRTLTFSIPATLPPLTSSTHARLHLPHHPEILAPLTTKNTFIFPLSSLILPQQEQAQDWYLSIVSKEYVFAPYVVSVAGNGSVVTVYSAKVGRRKVGEGIRLEFVGEKQEVVEEEEGGEKRRDHVVELRVRGGRKEYYQEREGFNPIGLLKSPMILIGIVGLAFVIGVPYLLENMDPETRAEFEAQQKKSVFAGLAGASAGGGPMGPSGGDMQNFDLASWMAGRGSGSGAGRSGSGEGEGSATGREGEKGVRRRG